MSVSTVTIFPPPFISIILPPAFRVRDVDEWSWDGATKDVTALHSRLFPFPPLSQSIFSPTNAIVCYLELEIKHLHFYKVRKYETTCARDACGVSPQSFYLRGQVYKSWVFSCFKLQQQCGI